MFIFSPEFIRGLLLCGFITGLAAVRLAGSLLHSLLKIGYSTFSRMPSSILTRQTNRLGVEDTLVRAQF